MHVFNLCFWEISLKKHYATLVSNGFVAIRKITLHFDLDSRKKNSSARFQSTSPERYTLERVFLSIQIHKRFGANDKNIGPNGFSLLIDRNLGAAINSSTAARISSANSFVSSNVDFSKDSKRLLRTWVIQYGSNGRSHFSRVNAASGISRNFSLALSLRRFLRFVYKYIERSSRCRRKNDFFF